MIDWSVIGSATTALGAMFTGVGVMFGAYQIRLTKKQGIAEFEDRFDQQYRELSMQLPVDVLIGQKPTKEDRLRVRELIYNYCDLSNEQVYLRAKGKVTQVTWMSWSSGIKAHLERPAFQDVYEEIKNASGFTYLDRLINEDFKTDPNKWY
jgi:hypothetical protein